MFLFCQSLLNLIEMSNCIFNIVMRIADDRSLWKMFSSTGRQRTCLVTNFLTICTPMNLAVHLLDPSDANSSRTRRNSVRSTKLWLWATSANPIGPGISVGVTATLKQPTYCVVIIPGLTFYPNVPSPPVLIGFSWAPLDWGPTCT